MDAFFPANQYPAVVVQVHYYISTMDNQLSEDSQYIYRWVSTPALLFGDPKVLEGLSLRALVVHQRSASLVIAPFAKNLDNERKKELLSNVTTWVSYCIIILICKMYFNIMIFECLFLVKVICHKAFINYRVWYVNSL